MSTVFKNKNIISTILNEEGNFTEEDILKKMDIEYEKKEEKHLINQINNVLKGLQKIDLINDTMLYYYVK